MVALAAALVGYTSLAIIKDKRTTRVTKLDVLEFMASSPALVVSVAYVSFISSIIVMPMVVYVGAVTMLAFAFMVACVAAVPILTT